MAIVQQLSLFSWKDFHNDLLQLGDLERFKLVIETIPDEKLIQVVQNLRGHGRNDHPIVAVWNSILAGIVFEHVSIESLRRELKRNAQLRELCGFNPFLGAYAIPSKSAYSRFMRKMFVDLNTVHPELLERCEHAMFDRGYDSTDTICDLWEKYGIKAVIDIRNMWKDGEETRLLQSKNIQNVTYNFKGTVFCHCPETSEIRQMVYGGFEKIRETHKYTCPARAYGIECKGSSKCPLYQKSIRIPLEEDRRIFTPVARSSYKWKTLYNKRSSIERLNSRIDVSFGFERHYIRGHKKMELRCGLALCVMLAIAVGRLRQKRPKLMRSLVKTAA